MGKYFSFVIEGLLLSFCTNLSYLTVSIFPWAKEVNNEARKDEKSISLRSISLLLVSNTYSFSTEVSLFSFSHGLNQAVPWFLFLKQET